MTIQNSQTQTQKVDALIEQLRLANDGLKNGKNEENRVIALKTAQKLVQAFEEPQEAVTKLALAPVQTMCLRIGIDLGVFEALTKKNRPTPLKELAAIKDADPRLTERILRVLTRIGFIDEYDTRVYSPNELTRGMSDPKSSAMIKYLFDVPMVTLAKTPEYFRNVNFQTPSEANKGPFQYAEKTDKSEWDWMLDHPDLMESCHEFLHKGDRGGRRSWVDWFPVQERVIDGFQSTEGDVLITDIAGGKGYDLLTFHEKHPTAPGRLVLQDQAHVVEGLPTDDRIEKQAFDLFKPQPIQGARAYYMKFILHDWTDEQCLQILEQLRGSMKKGYSKLIIEEFILADKDASMLPTMWDLEMLIHFGSMERARDHWEKLLASAGFKVVQFWYPPGDGQGIIEAEVA